MGRTISTFFNWDRRSWCLPSSLTTYQNGGYLDQRLLGHRHRSTKKKPDWINRTSSPWRFNFYRVFRGDDVQRIRIRLQYHLLIHASQDFWIQRFNVLVWHIDMVLFRDFESDTPILQQNVSPLGKCLSRNQMYKAK